MSKNLKIKKPLRRHSGYRYGVEPWDFEKPTTLPSEAVPGQALSMAELLKRHHEGTLIPVGKNPMYGDDLGVPVDFDSPDMEKLRDSDLVERQEFLQANAQLKNEMDKKHKDIKEKLTAKEKAEFDQRVRDAMLKDEPAKTKKSGNEPTVD